ncbi:nitric oxide synthase 2b, inducible [Osmerus mordax]|uniref:nitric oxide synthase 2b, inducible n=1 Tax=Osmerus mordax TaxID=8014 RepID=UPI003510C13B
MKVLQDDKTKSLLAEPKLETRTRCPFSLAINNTQNGSRYQDTLHKRAVKNQPCESIICQGSLMTPKTLIWNPKLAPTAHNDILPQAIDLINQYFKSKVNPKTEDHLARLETIVMETDVTGTYELTLEELSFAAKQAWRNAPRCIGRIQWSNLQVFDGRKCTTTQEMFDLLCNHLKYATNGGNLRSAITIFRQRMTGKGDFRVWNSQLLKYAGYGMPDGSIQGDPSSLEFTQICIQLGWRPKYGLFDMLPLVLQANGEDPDLFEIPLDCILEVAMEHPQHEWFKDLGLKWYALPAVSSMLLEVGGLEFSACPFNGWYMGTEIGVRDFCDYQRYNILEEVGRKMGLHTHRLSSLWKDQALVTINVAVIHSFQKNKVTITDHHSAAESFMKHMESEYRLRGGCPADWVWVVPPMSGSLTPVFHQEMVNYILSPFYYYQTDPWISHNWSDKKKFMIRQKISFKAVARVVLLSSIFMRRFLASRVKCTVLFASETGKSQTFALKLHTMINGAFNSRMLCMEDYNISDIDTESLLIVVTSTFGNGNPPANGESFKEKLFSLLHLSKELRYCVFGLGSRMYPKFCAFAHTVDNKLEELGALRLAPIGEGDEMNGQEEAFLAWASVTLKVACEEFNIQMQLSFKLPGADQLCESWEPMKYRVSHENSHFDRCAALAAAHSKTVLPMKLKRRQDLQSSHSSQSTILVELEIETRNDFLSFCPGDHVGIFPGNQLQQVAGILKFIPNTPPTNQSLCLEYCSDSYYDNKRNWATVGRIPACPLSQALTYFLDVTTPPSQNLLYKLSQITNQDEHCQRLLTLATDIKEYTTWKMFKCPTFLEVLEEFPTLEPSEAFLYSQLPLLKPRLYSISSSLNLNPNEIHVTVAVVNYHTEDGQGPLHHGVCSTWLNNINEGDMVPCYIQSSSGFHLPAEGSAPIILVGNGSGIAPFRGFWQQRLCDMKCPGFSGTPMNLVFGCQTSETDHLYKEETLDMTRQGVLKNVISAYSRQPGQPKVYVQDILREKMAEEVLRVLHQQGGHLYVCGGANMAHGVTLAVQDILCKQLGMSSTQAEDYVTQLKIKKKYHEDIYGVKI